jgi:hypothetical protein
MSEQEPSQIQEKRQYRDAFVKFNHSIDWHWMVTIGIGSCPTDDELLRRLRIIEAQLCGKYLSSSDYKLADADRYSMMVGFEGERGSGNRHAHILVHVPKPTKLWISQDAAITQFDWEFWHLWLWLNDSVGIQHCPYSMNGALSSEISDGEDQASTTTINLPVKIDRVGSGPARTSKHYAIKRLSNEDAPWSDVQFVTPPKAKKFENENTKKINNRNRKASLKLKRYERQLARLQR